MYWSNWASTSASGTDSTPSILDISGKSNFGHSLNLCSLSGIKSSHTMPPLIGSSVPPRLSSLWTTRRTQSEGNLPPTSGLSVHTGFNILFHRWEQGCPAHTPVIDYPDTHQSPQSIRVYDTIEVFQKDAARFFTVRLVFAPEDFMTHSLHSVGYMAMNIIGVPDHTLVVIGQ